MAVRVSSGITGSATVSGLKSTYRRATLSQPCLRPRAFRQRQLQQTPRLRPRKFRAVEEGEEVTSVEESSPVQSEVADKDEVATPNYAIWIISLMSVIAVFYAVVFYAGAGFFYFLSKKVDFKKKDFVPYSERMEKERQELLKSLQTAPEIVETEETEIFSNPDS